MTAEPARGALRAELLARLLPLVVVLVVLVATGAPLGYYAMRVSELRTLAAQAADATASALARRVASRPRLWPFDADKLVAEVDRRGVHRALRHVEVLDTNGHRVAATGERPTAALVWAKAPVRVGGRAAAEVWVAAGLDEARRDALGWLGVFLAAALLLGGGVLAVPLGAVARAERRIGGLLAELEKSREALRERNESLEGELRLRLDELQDAHARLRASSWRALLAAERQRQTIARELHDGLGQELTALRIAAELCEQHRDDPSRVARLVEGMRDGASRALDELRRAVRALRPVQLDEAGLHVALRRLAEDAAERGGIRVEAHIDPLQQPLPAAVELAVYRVAQEALGNVLRHAAARRVWVALRRDPAGLVLEVRDDGRGFDEAAENAGLGLQGMRERAALLGGELSIHSTPSVGTTVRFLIPPSSLEEIEGGDEDVRAAGGGDP
ncbi:MAG: sensor histidine kinase [Myxococcota bacterium]|nr:sensor histidine kinase [Myxococcota bacterium]